MINLVKSAQKVGFSTFMRFLVKFVFCKPLKSASSLHENYFLPGSIHFCDHFWTTYFLKIHWLWILDKYKLEKWPHGRPCEISSKSGISNIFKIHSKVCFPYTAKNTRTQLSNMVFSLRQKMFELLSIHFWLSLSNSWEPGDTFTYLEHESRTHRSSENEHTW